MLFEPLKCKVKHPESEQMLYRWGLIVQVIGQLNRRYSYVEIGC